MFNNHGISTNHLNINVLLFFVLIQRIKDQGFPYLYNKTTGKYFPAIKLSLMTVTLLNLVIFKTISYNQQEQNCLAHGHSKIFPFVL